MKTILGKRMETVWQDVRYGIRRLLKSPAFTLLAVLVLALGIGANTAMFSVVNALLFRPLAVTRPAELIGVYSKDRKPEGGYRTFSYPNYVAIREKNTVFSSLLAFNFAMVGLTEGEITRRAFATVVSADYFPTFGVRPVAGRDFLPEEEKPGVGIPVAIVSHNYWKRHGSDPALVGRTLLINSRTFTIIGVAPEHFTGTAVLFSPDVWLPLGVNEWVVNDFMERKGQRLSDRNYHCLLLVGRLKSGLTAVGAQAQLQALAQQLEDAYPAENKDQTFVLSPLPRVGISTNPRNNSRLKGLAALLMPMSGVVLVIACLNLANMMLARGAARRKEIAVRAALGGGRGRILRQLLTEGLLLSVLAGASGLLLAYWSTNVLASSLGSKLPFMTIAFRAGPDHRVLAATLGFCVLATLFFAFVPAWKLTRTDVMQDLKEHIGEDRRSRSGNRLLAARSLLVMGQIALSLVLLTVAGLFVRGAQKAARADPGFRFEQGLLVEVDASLAGYDEAKGRALYRTVLERLRALPQVEAASFASMVPFGIFNDGRAVQRAGGSGAKDGAGSGAEEKPVAASYAIIGTDYFKSLGLPMLRGREFDRLETENGTTARVAIIDETLAKRLWPNEDAVGRQIQFAERAADKQPVVMQVVGVAPGLRHDMSDKGPVPHVYVPIGQNYQSMMNIHVRLASRDPATEPVMLKTVRAAIRAVDERLPILSVNTLRDFHNEGLTLWFVRAGARLFVVFGTVAVFLAVVGVYAVKAFVVARRTREIGIRIALGATTRQVLWLVLREGIKLTAAGLAAGLLLALATGRLLSSKLYEVSGADPITFVSASVLLAGAALLACYFPARRAARVEPMSALRYE